MQHIRSCNPYRLQLLFSTEHLKPMYDFRLTTCDSRLTYNSSILFTVAQLRVVAVRPSFFSINELEKHVLP